VDPKVVNNDSSFLMFMALGNTLLKSMGERTGGMAQVLDTCLANEKPLVQILVTAEKKEEYGRGLSYAFNQQNMAKVMGCHFVIT
jgi:hypothetical protein